MKTGWLCLVIAALLVGADSGTISGQTPPAGDNKLRIVKYADLAREIVAQRGKVVVIDFWSIY
jgi:hypothetical protein